jgi:hypothetical protein
LSIIISTEDEEELSFTQGAPPRMLSADFLAVLPVLVELTEPLFFAVVLFTIDDRVRNLWRR